MKKITRRVMPLPATVLGAAQKRPLLTPQTNKMRGIRFNRLQNTTPSWNSASGGRKGDMLSRVLTTQNASLVLYQPMSEASGSVAVDYSGKANAGAYTGVTLGQQGIGDSLTCPLFDGATSFNDQSANALGAQANYDKGTVAAWARILSLGVWTDGVARDVLRMSRDLNNLIEIGRSTVDNQLQFNRIAAGTNKQVLTTVVGGVLDWFHVAMTWDTTADELKAYVNGVQVGATQTAIGTFVGGGTTNEFIGAQSAAPLKPWSGLLAHVPVWTLVLAPAELLNLGHV